jgi:predicted permease
MLQTLAITGPIYLVIALGLLAGRVGVFGKPYMRVLGTYVVEFALPALVFTALSQRPVSEVMNGRAIAPGDQRRVDDERPLIPICVQ